MLGHKISFADDHIFKLNLKDIAKKNKKVRSHPEIKVEIKTEELDESKFGTVECFVDGDIERVFKLKFPKYSVVDDVLQTLSSMVNVIPQGIVLFRNNEQLHRKDYIFNKTHEGEIVAVNVEFKQNSESSSDEESIDHEFIPQINEICVKHTSCDDFGPEPPNVREEMVIIENEAFAKEYLGGYRNKKTNVLYFNASTQTHLRRRTEKSTSKKNTREIQTHLPYVETGMSTVNEKSTQMWRTDLYIPSVTDKIIEAKRFKNYDSIKKTMIPLEAVIVIQRAWRNYKKRKLSEERRQMVLKNMKADELFSGMHIQETFKHRSELLIGNVYPKVRKDFYYLYNILESWKQQHLRELKEYKESFAYKAAVCDLFDDVVKGLYSIEKKKIQIKEENLKQQDVRFLEKISRPRVKRYPKGNITAVEDLPLQRARELKENYSNYKRKDLKLDERIDMLINLKDSIGKLGEIDLTLDLIKILDREIDLLRMGVDDSKLTVLRQRFESQFFKLVKDPVFNPAALAYQKNIEIRGSHPLYRCKGCGKVTRPCYFFTHLRLKSFGFCTSCSWMHTTSSNTVNLAPYQKILKNVRAKEKAKCCRSAIIFLLQPMGMYFIVQVLWNGQSILSGSRHLPELTVTRWISQEEWSPWNTILLTEKEAVLHDAIENPELYYSRQFILKVKSKLILARMHFTTPFRIEKYISETGQWLQASKDEGFYTSIIHSKKFDKVTDHTFFEPVPATHFTNTRRGEVQTVDAGT